jgi:putative tricarboxylic transport membrane protein
MTPSLWGERLAGAAFILIAVYMGSLAWEFPAGGSMFPLFVSALMIIVSLIMIAHTFLVPQNYAHDGRSRFTLVALKPIALTVVIVLYVLIVFHLGYYATTFLLLLALPFALGLRRPIFILCAAFGATAFIYALFEIGLKAGMPSGVLL